MVRTALSKANRLWCRESNSALRTTGNLAARVVESVKLLVYLERWTSTSRRFSLPLPPALRVPAFSARATHDRYKQVNKQVQPRSASRFRPLGLFGESDPRLRTAGPSGNTHDIKRRASRIRGAGSEDRGPGV